MGTYATAKGLDPYVAAVGLLDRNRTDVGMLGFAMSEDTIDRLLAHPFSMVCSDGGAFAIDGPTRRGSPHPRGAGTFPRVLGRYVRERKALALATGMAGDVVVFDTARVADTATFANPFQYPRGIVAVVVNGAIAVRDGQRPSGGAGKVLRPA
jgi:N-acyl-D-amino-acid deacylase